MKKWLAICLIFALLLGTLTGCGGSGELGAPEETPEPTPVETEAPVETESPEEGEEIDYMALYQEALDTVLDTWKTHDTDTAVFTVNGAPVTWGEFYYFLNGELQNYLYYLGTLPEDFNVVFSGETTLAQYFMDSVLFSCKYYSIAHQKAQEMNVTVSEESEESIQSSWEQLLEEYGGEDALAEAMADSCLEKETFLSLLRGNEELVAVMEALYGAGGEEMTEEEVLNWAAEQGYIRVKHILYINFDDTGVTLDEDALAEQKVRAEATLAELQALAGDSDALEARFDEIMNADSGDGGGLINFPEGYTFTEGTMYPVFEEAAFALEDYGLSELVESQSGYHIILRLPLDTEGLTMDRDANTGAYMTLRQTAANELFQRELLDWIQTAEVEWTPGFEDLDLNELFGIVPPEAEE